MKTICRLLALSLLLSAATVSAQLKPYTDYEPAEAVSHISTIRVQANMIDDYLEGIRSTWVAALSAKTSYRSGWRATTSSVLEPTEPVEPRMESRCFIGRSGW